MTWRRLTAPLWLVAALAAGEVLCPLPGHALQTGFQAGQGSDTLTISAESGTLPKYTVHRTGAQEITVLFHPAPGEKAAAAPSVGGSKLVSGVRAIPGGIKIQLRTSGFGYVHSAPSGKLQIQVFSDPIGSRWKMKEGARPPPSPDKAGAKPRPLAAKTKPRSAPSTRTQRSPFGQRQAAKPPAGRGQEARRDRAEARRELAAAKRERGCANRPRLRHRLPPCASTPQVHPAGCPAAEGEADATTGQPYFSVPYPCAPR
jgi:hypothetical protein